MQAKSQNPANYNQNGQKIGSKGQRTRRLLIDTTVELLETHGLRDLSVVDVARHAGTSSATFYVYFRDVPEVVLAALDIFSPVPEELEALINHDWFAPKALDQALAFVEAYTQYWNQHRTIFLVRNLASEEGDERFYDMRAETMRPLLDAMSHQIAHAQTTGRMEASLDPWACAGTLAMMLERLASVGPLSATRRGVSYEALKRSAAYTFAHMLGARE